MSSTGETVIGLLSWDYGRPKGGMGRSLQCIVRALHHGGLRITVLAPCTGEQGTDPLLPLTGRIGGQMLFSLLLPFVLNRRIRKEGVTGLILPVGPGGVLLLRRPPVRSTAIVYHSYAQQAALVPGQRWKKIFRRFERRTLAECSHILCFCADTRDALIAAYGIDPQKITVLPHAIDRPRPSSVQRELGLCICVARLEQRKGVTVLLQAWSSIAAAVPHARLVIVGDGVQRKTVDRMIASSPRVERCASVTQNELQDLLARAEVAFCPAYLEGFGLACAEAMAAGCIVIASDADGLRQLVQDNRGVLVPAGDGAALASATISLFADASNMKEIRSKGAAFIRTVCDPARADRALCDAVRSAYAVDRA
jgi:glycosyltransferase involved in cell wall biosynthesis